MTSILQALRRVLAFGSVFDARTTQPYPKSITLSQTRYWR